MTTTATVIGAPIPRQEGPDKVSGRATYAADVNLPGMLYGSVLRSPYAHARIKSLDASGAWQVPGVKAVVTGADEPGHVMGRQLQDMPVLCWEKVRFIGDRVAAVAAETKEAAEEAIQLIRVEYEELPAVFDVLQAMDPGAPRLHDDVASYEGAPAQNLATDLPNGLSRVVYKKGDVEQGFRDADRIIEHMFTVPSRHAGYIEPHAGVVSIDPDGRVQVWQSTKSPFRTRKNVSQGTGVPERQIRVNPVYVGGDFGGKGDAMDLPIAYFLAKRAGRPVKMVMSYTEELMAADPDHPAVITIRTGVKNDGRMTARTIRAIHSTGAYGAFKPTPQVAIGGVSHGAGPYKIEHTLFEALQVYTNQVPCGFYRAPGAPQAMFAEECHTDLIAKELGMDPGVFRLKNVLDEGDVNGIGHKLHDVKAREVLEAALEAAGSNPKPGPYWGRGIAMYERSIPGGPSGSVITARADGNFAVITPVFDQGVGTHTVLRQIVAAQMGVPIDRVNVVAGDTDTAPPDPGVGGSRVTHTAGQATVKACDLLKEELCHQAASLLECPVEEVAYGEGAFWPREAPNRRVSSGDVVAHAGGPVTVTGTVERPAANDISCFVAQVAEVEVDPDTGQVRLHRFITVHDVGTVINPIMHQGQIEGGVVQGIGQGLMEDLGIEDGRVTAAHLGDYKLPNIKDIPTLETVLIQAGGGPAPYDGKAIGEMANVSPAAAIANAVDDAVGVRLFTIPVTSERVYGGLREKQG